ncbi:DEAD/DEAH box helicase [Alicyclobacillus sp. SP_1]|uniref:DEAD/DEAH box helicase n=1 Tax=Alicyclobacillus sp. SP_1 TaxID=2942475 RepID=UPI0021580905|nr:DEAD/DEAH box helicase [Alicyclobacillus sp. SP_1]
MELAMLLEEWRRTDSFIEQVASWQIRAARLAAFRPTPGFLHEALVAAVRKRNVENLYTHQVQALEEVHAGNHIILTTPTASGKTLCYNLPILDTILKDMSTRALYIFPTKALAQDQVAEWSSLTAGLTHDGIHAFTYDGDTPMHVRQRIREAGHVVVTNPDMLHSAILPHHTKWLRLFENLRFIVIDEAHMYRGVFGSHFANVLRRLLRICAFYGSQPQFILCSATIANPEEHAFRLTGQSVTWIGESGAPEGERHTILYNPPLLNRELGIRKSSILEARRLGARLLTENITTLAFVKTRTQVEILSGYWKRDVPERLRTRVMGYRGGYLPSERRTIERGLRAGEIRGVVSTNALELGMDIGSLDAVLTVGHPGSIASVRQQSGRAGRRQGLSLSLFIANASALDQFLVLHPNALLEAPPEEARLSADNLLILMDHVKCGAFELPFSASEQFGDESVGELLSYLADHRVLHRQSSGTYLWMAESMPSLSVSLRSASTENVVIVDTSAPEPKVLGETDRFSALTTLHEEAIYLHQTKSFQVERLDLENGKAFVRSVEADYFTEAELAVRLQMLHLLDGAVEHGKVSHALAEVMVNATPTIFKKLKLETHENLGWGRVHLPEAELHSIGYAVSWPETAADLAKDEWETALAMLGYLLRHTGAVYAMCAVSDLHAAVHVRDVVFEQPTVYLYDAYPGGIGLAERLYRAHGEVFAAAFEVVTACPCEQGCPSCTGPRPRAFAGENPKDAVCSLLRALLRDADEPRSGRVSGTGEGR